MKGVFANNERGNSRNDSRFWADFALRRAKRFYLSARCSFTKLLAGVTLVVSASLCDTALIIMPVTGVSAAVAGIPAVKIVLIAAGTCFLLFIGWVTWNSRPSGEDTGSLGMTAKKQIAFAAAVSLLNPHAILDIVGVIGTNSLTYDGREKWLFTGSCIFVSWIWFAGLASAGRILRRLDSRGSVLIFFNKISAVMMWMLAVYLGASLFA